MTSIVSSMTTITPRICKTTRPITYSNVSNCCLNISVRPAIYREPDVLPELLAILGPATGQGQPVLHGIVWTDDQRGGPSSQRQLDHQNQPVLVRGIPKTVCHGGHCHHWNSGSGG